MRQFYEERIHMLNQNKLAQSYLLQTLQSQPSRKRRLEDEDPICHTFAFALARHY